MHPLLLTTAGTGVGGLVIVAAGLTGLLPLTAHIGATELGGVAVSWWLPLLLLITVTAVFAYITGIVAVRRLGSSVASFVSLSEVIFAVVFAAVAAGPAPLRRSSWSAAPWCWSGSACPAAILDTLDLCSP